MIDAVTLVGLIGVLVFAAHFFDWLFSHTKIPDALLLMLVGLVLGPVLGVLSPAYFGEAGELAVIIVLVILLYQSGLGLRYSTLREAWRSTVVLSTTSFLATMLLVAGVMWLLFAFEPLVAFIVGAIVGGTSSAVVIPLLRQLSVTESTRATLMLESVFSDVLAIVVTFALLEAYSVGFLNVPLILLDVFLSFTVAIIVGLLAALAWARLLRLVRHLQNSLLITPALVLVLYGVVEQLGFSGPIAALAFGFLMGNVGHLNSYLAQRHPFLQYVLMASPLRKRERLFLAEAVFLLQTFFFVFVGISLRVTHLEPIVIGLALVVLMMMARVLVVRVAVPKEVVAQDTTIMAVMVPKGLAAAALAALPLQLGVPSGALVQDTIYAIILFSVVATSLLVFAVHRTRIRDWYRSLLGENDQSEAASL